MILILAFLLFAEGLNEKVSCHSLGVTGNENISAQLIRQSYRGDDNSILDSIKGRNTKSSSQRSKRNLELSTSSTETSSTNVAYKRAINQTISDYYIQRKAVMDRYYARQREIVEKFARRTAKPERAEFRSTFRPTVSQQILVENSTTVVPIVNTTQENYQTEKIEKAEDNRPLKMLTNERQTDREEKNNSSSAWIYRSNNWNPKVLDSDTDIDLEPESSNTLERSVDRRTIEIPGYYKLGNFKGSKDEKIVYQHNLGVGVKGPSQLDATFEAVIEGPYEITIVEAFPYANTRANFTWLSGGPGTNFVKLKLQGYENEGFSYSVKVWGIPRKIPQ